MLAEIMGTVAAPAPWGRYAYHEATLRDLTSSLGSSLKKTGDTHNLAKIPRFPGRGGLQQLLSPRLSPSKPRGGLGCQK